MINVKWVLVFAFVFVLSLQSQAQQNENLQSLNPQIADARNKGNMDQADLLANKLLQQAEKQNNLGMQAEAFYQLARNSMERNQYETAQALLSRAIEYFEELNDIARLGETYRQLGLTYRYQVNYPKALEYIYLAMQIFEQLGDKRSISSGHNSIGVVLERMGQYEQALYAHQRALELNYELDDQQGVASSLYNIGDIRRKMGDVDLALKYFNEVLVLDEKAGNLKDIAYTNLKIGRVYLIKSQSENARVHIEKALTLFRQIQTPRDTDWALTSLAELELLNNNLARAEKILQGVIKRAIENQYKSLLVDAYEISAELAFQQQRYLQALQFVNAGINQANANQTKADEAELVKLSVKIYLANDDLKNAFTALQRQKELDDEILNAKRIDSIARVQAQTEFVRRAHQIELLEKEKVLQEFSRNFWISLTIAFFILLFLLYWRFTQRQVNQKLTELVSIRTQELQVKNNQLEKAYQEMEAISLTDKLTAIHNRRFLDNHINADLEQSHRVYQEWRLKNTAKPAQADIVTFIIDMDNFKQVNDQYGHNSGDMVLIQLAQRMADVFRQSDYLVRWGGEEFVAVARFIERSDASILAERMRSAVSQKPFVLSQGEPIDLTCSIGFACYPPTPNSDYHCNWKSLIALADACLYRAKHSGKNTWVGVDQVNDSALFDAEITAGQLEAMEQEGKLSLQLAR